MFDDQQVNKMNSVKLEESGLIEDYLRMLISLASKNFQNKTHSFLHEKSLLNDISNVYNEVNNSSDSKSLDLINIFD